MPKKKPPKPRRRVAARGASEPRPFPIVGIGASAGGLEAMKLVLSHIAPRTRLAIVYLQHLDPSHVSYLIPLLSGAAGLHVVAAADGVAVEAGNVYVAPPRHDVKILDGTLRLTPLGEGKRTPHAIDAFFESLAKDQAWRAVGVVLSGNGSDGAMGLNAIKAAGGAALAQSPASAKFDGMPRSAAASGAVECVLTPEEIAHALCRLARRFGPAAREGKDAPVAPPLPGGDPIARILTLLWSAEGIDFHGYKPPMIRRRILRRMALRHMKAPEAYAQLLQENREAINELISDLLIKVTRFFRDPETFRTVKSRVIPAILKERAPGAPVRVWVPGCASGEEAYSLAMCLIEAVGDRSERHAIQVFGTDIDEDAIRRARIGIYSPHAVRGVSPERLRRFFHKVEGGYQIEKRVRDLCVYARHDVTRDPPFSNLDIVSCRNVLIYLQPSIQRRVVQLFHYALNAGGFLVLGTAETTGASDLFAPFASKVRRIYARRTASVRGRVEMVPSALLPERAPETGRTALVHTWDALSGSDVHREADRVVMGRFAPPGVLINDRLEIVQFRGDTSPYLLHGPGEASLGLLKMARDDLAQGVRTAVTQARREDATVRRTGLQVLDGKGLRETSIEVIPVRLPSSKNPHFLVLFEDAGTTAPLAGEAAKTKGARAPRQQSAGGEGRASLLERELRVTKERLRAVGEEYDAATEELRAAMEELTSSNEELQSINEELETAKEELQSTNEELTTLNEELQSRNTEMTQINVDVQNLLASVDIPIVMLGRDLSIRRFTRPAEQLFSLIASDVGRPLGDLRPSIDSPDLEPQIRRVISGGPSVQREVHDRQGRCYSLWIRPYLTVDGKVDGAVVTLFDVTERKRSEEVVRLHADRLELLSEIDASILHGASLETVARLALTHVRRFVPAGLAGVLLLDEPRGEVSVISEDDGREDGDGRPAARLPVSQFGSAYPLSTTDNLSFDDLSKLADAPPALEKIRSRGFHSLVSVPLKNDGHVIGRLFAAESAPRTYGKEHVDAARDIADHLAVAFAQAKLYEEVRAARVRLQNLAQSLVEAQEAERRRVAKELHDEVGQLLTAIKLSLVPAIAIPDLAPRFVASLTDAVQQVDRLITVVRALSLELRPTVLDDLGLLPALVSNFDRFTGQTGVRVKFEQEGLDRRFPTAVETAAYRIVQEALTNVVRHAGVTEATVRIWGDADKVDVQIEDAGVGFDTSAPRRSTGLSGMAERASALGGELSIDSRPGHGTRLLATLPIPGARQRVEA